MNRLDYFVLDYFVTPAYPVATGMRHAAGWQVVTAPSRRKGAALTAAEARAALARHVHARTPPAHPAHPAPAGTVALDAALAKLMARPEKVRTDSYRN